VVGAEPEVEAARLGLCVATKRAIAATLALLGVAAPERM
jgi:arginyl-tRNA synthetase